MKQCSRRHAVILPAFTALFFISACNTPTLSQNTNERKEHTILSKQVLINSQQSHTIDYTVDGSLLKRMTIDLSVDKHYGSLSLYANDKLLVNNIDIPRSGRQKLNVLVPFDETGNQKLRFAGRSNNITINEVTFEDVSGLSLPTFEDISQSLGFETEITYKYGGPAVADYDQDGDYDFALNNHNHVPTQIVTNNTDSLDIRYMFSSPRDLHGSSFGDYDRDGDLDLLVALGGGSGTNPTSYELFRNDDNEFVNVSNEAGINVPTRGRSPRWVDIDLDGDLDIALFNAQRPNYDGPIQVFYENVGGGKFENRSIKGLEDAYAERTLVTDINQDGKDDFLIFSPAAVWINKGNWEFEDASSIWLPEHIQGQESIINAANLDVNNDGLVDLYFARGKTHYQLSRKSIDFNPNNQKLDIRDDGETGSTLIEFEADGSIELNDMELVYRLYDGGWAIFLGENKDRKVVNAKGFQPRQRPEEMKTAERFLNISPDMAKGWPDKREQNGMYIGYLGNGKWKAEWVRKQNVFWTISFSLIGVKSVEHDWQPNYRNEKDVLLLNKGGYFVDASDDWNIPPGGDHWGVTHGDLNNDGYEDIFLYRYGFLKQRIADLVLINTGENRFEITTQHGAYHTDDPGHGDMGQAFDFDQDGRLDMLNGSEEEGRWHLYKNTTKNDNNYILVDVNYSPKDKVDPYSASVKVTTNKGRVYQKRIGSAGESFSQSLLNKVHFGLGKETGVKSALIEWRNGETLELTDLQVNMAHSAGTR
ncbi:CRTAC1 family protein [Agaribacter flavus]|uniref:CRTAC1 family protein n=1 Tax=Agaribacter flavus TaxID=1902781 RepID=A0ABV7FSI0_9ALTE